MQTGPRPRSTTRARGEKESGTYSVAFDVQLAANHARGAHFLTADGTQLHTVFARLRADDAHETCCAAGTPSAAHVSLKACARRSTDRTETLRVTARAERVLDERKATLTLGARGDRSERVACVDLDGCADIWTAWVDVSIQAGIGQRCDRSAGARDGIATARDARAPSLTLTPRAARRRADLDAAAAMEQREDGAENKHSPDSPAHESQKDSTLAR